MTYREPTERELRRRLTRDLEEATQPGAERLARMLAPTTLAVDDVTMARRVVAALRPELARRAAVDLRRQVLVRVVVAAVPLPFVIAYAGYVLRALYAPVAVMLSPDVAGYVAAVHIMLLTLLFGATYAVIPMMLARRAYDGAVTSTA
jgi:hypothetical protein